MFGFGGEVIPEVLQVNAFAAFDQGQRDVPIKMKVPKVAHEPDAFPIADTGQKSIHQHDAFGFLRELRGVSIRNHQSNIVTNNARAIKAERPYQIVNIHGHVLLVVTGIGFRRIPHAPQIRRDDGMVFSQQRNEWIPHVTGFGVTVEQHDGTALAADDVMYSRSVYLHIAFSKANRNWFTIARTSGRPRQEEKGDERQDGYANALF